MLSSSSPAHLLAGLLLPVGLRLTLLVLPNTAAVCLKQLRQLL